MAKANKKSLDAKAYINAQVNEMREKINKAPDEGTRKQLVENFKETTASEEYQENLAVVQEDTDVIRKEAREKKGGDITSEEFKDAKTEFYGKNMSLDFGEDFEKLDLGKKVDYIFEKFGDTDYAADLIIELLKPLVLPNDSFTSGLSYVHNVGKILFGLNNPSAEELYRGLSKYFGDGIVTARIYFYLAEHTHYAGGLHSWTNAIPWNFGNMTENTLKRIITPRFEEWINKVGGFYGIVFLLKGCKDGSIADLGLIKNLEHVILYDKHTLVGTIEKFSSEGQKYIIDYITKKNYDDYILEMLFMGSNNKLNLGEGTDTNDFIFSVMLHNSSDDCIEEVFNNKEFSYLPQKSRKIADLFIKAGRKDLLEKCIDRLLLSEEEKSEILGK